MLVKVQLECMQQACDQRTEVLKKFLEHYKHYKPFWNTTNTTNHRCLCLSLIPNSKLIAQLHFSPLKNINFQTDFLEFESLFEREFSRQHILNTDKVILKAGQSPGRVHAVSFRPQKEVLNKFSRKQLNFQTIDVSACS